MRVCVCAGVGGDKDAMPYIYVEEKKERRREAEGELERQVRGKRGDMQAWQEERKGGGSERQVWKCPSTCPINRPAPSRYGW